MPGGGAEILNDRIRQKLCPDKATAQEWLEVSRTAALARYQDRTLPCSMVILKLLKNVSTI